MKSLYDLFIHLEGRRVFIGTVDGRMIECEIEEPNTDHVKVRTNRKSIIVFDRVTYVTYSKIVYVEVA